MTDKTSDKTTGMLLIMAIHLVCCGLPLFLLSGGSLALLAPTWPIATGIVAVLGVIGLGWHLRRRNCSTCPRPSPRGFA